MAAAMVVVLVGEAANWRDGERVARITKGLFYVRLNFDFALNFKSLAGAVRRSRVLVNETAHVVNCR